MESAGSKRWTHFHAAVQLAIQRAAHKWSYSDFAECFTLWCEEQPGGAAGVYNAVSGHMETQISERCEALFQEYDVKNNLDILHAAVTEARARKQQGIKGKDVWREDIQPKTAVRARVVPLLEEERDTLRARLQEFEAENLRLQEELERTRGQKQEVEDQTVEMLDQLEEVYQAWKDLRLEDMEMWAVQTAEQVQPATS